MITSEKNVDLVCARSGQAIGSVCDVTTIQKSLGILEGDGIYAYFIYLLYLKRKEEKSKKSNAVSILTSSKELLGGYHLFPNSGMNIEIFNLDGIMTSVTNNVHDLFFAKEILRRALVYARYFAKARGAESS